MTQTAHSPRADEKRPKGILKNSRSYQHISQDAGPTSPLSEQRSPPIPTLNEQSSTDAAANNASNGHDHDNRPGMPPRIMSEKEIVQHNTELNAGERRGSTGPRTTMSRRQSSNSQGENAENNQMRLKWDEANLYLNEGQMGGKMKIDEPKTPYAKQYDPMEDDDDDIPSIDPTGIVVDEMELEKKSSKRTKETEIPGLDLGEPELAPTPVQRRESDSEKSVKVNSDFMDIDGGRHGEEDVSHMNPEELEKHRKFEEMRKKHYEMKNIKNLLGHSEVLDDGDEDDDDSKSQ